MHYFCANVSKRRKFLSRRVNRSVGCRGKYTGMDFFRGDASSIGHAQSAIFAVITEFVIN